MLLPVNQCFSFEFLFLFPFVSSFLFFFSLHLSVQDHVEISRLTSYLKESELWLLACRDAAVWYESSWLKHSPHFLFFPFFHPRCLFLLSTFSSRFLDSFVWISLCRSVLLSCFSLHVFVPFLSFSFSLPHSRLPAFFPHLFSFLRLFLFLSLLGTAI